MWRIVSLCAAVLASLCCQGQNIITTVAGTDFIFTGDGKRAVDVPLGPVAGVAAGSNGEIYITSATQNLVLKVQADGTIKRVAGNGLRGFSGESAAPLSASLDFPLGVAISGSGDVYVADQNNQRIRQISNGSIFTLAGDPFQPDLGDQGPANAASLSYPGALALNNSGTLYLTDGGHDRVRIVTPDGNISTIAGNGVRGFSGDGGNALLASLNNPQGVAVDKLGNIYIADAGNHRVRRVSADGTITTIAGTGGAGFSGDGGPATSAMLNFPTGVAVDTSGNVYIADFNNNRVRRLDTAGTIQTLAGGDQAGFSGDNGPATNALLNRVYAVAIDNRGNILIADLDNYRVRKIAADGTITTAAGNGSSRFSGDGGPAVFAALDGPQGVSTDAAGNLYIADTVNNRIRKIAAGGGISTIAGSGTAGFCGDGGTALNACVNLPIGSIASDGASNLYFADRDGNRVRRISPDGTISTIAGNGQPGFSGDGGPAILASLLAPTDIAIDSAGNLYIADGGNNRVRMVSPDGTIATLAGNGQAGFSGDGGPATAASLQTPYGVTVDAAGNLFIADKDNKRVRRVSSGVITTVAGNGLPLFSGDGDALSNSIDGPLKVAVDGAGNLFVVDFFNQRIRRISPDGLMTTVAGDGRVRFAGDGGPATSASLNAPTSVALDPAGNLFIADTGNNRIRAVLTTRPSFSVSPDNISLSAGAGGPASGPASVQVTSMIAGLAFSINVTTADGGSWLRVSASQNTMPSILTISGDPSMLALGQYSGTIQITAPDADPPIKTIAVTFNVGVRSGFGLVVEPGSLAFALTQNGNPETQLAKVSVGAGTTAFQVAATTSSGGGWLKTGVQTGVTTPLETGIIPITANPAGLLPGAYRGKVTVTPMGNGAPIETLVILTIRPPRSSLKLTQSGLLFTGVAGGGIGPSQTFGVANTGSGVMNWTVTAKTLSGGNWLSAFPPSGSTVPGAVLPSVSVTASAAGLVPGDYFGEVTVAAPGADNSPKTVTVVLRVLRQDVNPGAALDQVGVLFTAPVSGPNPGSQDVLIYNVTSLPVSFGTSSGSVEPPSFLTQIPATARLLPNQPVKVTIQPSTAGLGAGIHYGTVTLTFGDGTNRVISVALVLAPRRSAATSATGTPSVCTPGQLAVTISQAPNQGQFVPAGFPNQISALVFDDCGQPLVSGSVVATFSNGDPALPLFPRGNGVWDTTWTPARSSPDSITISFAAQDSQLGIRGAAVARTGVGGATEAPAINPDGIVNTVNLSPQAPLTPGGLISILGSRLANGQTSSPPQAWQTMLADTSVLLAGRLLPLQSASDGQISAIVPFDVPVNTKQSLVLQRGVAITSVGDLPMISAQPAIYTTNQAGSAQGKIFVIASDGTQKLADATNPATAGDTIVIRAAGLGAVEPALTAGIAAPATVAYSTASPVSLSIAGKDAQVLSAMLSPGEIGVYLLRAKVPSGIAAAPDAFVTISAAGQTSPAVTMAVK